MVAKNSKMPYLKWQLLNSDAGEKRVAMCRKFFHIAIIALACTTLAACDGPEEKYEKYLRRGDSYYQDHDYIKARLEYKNAAKIMPADPRAIYNLGLIEEAEGNLQSSLSAFLTCEQQDPAFKPVILKLAEFFLTAGQLDQARTRVEKMLEMEPDNAMAHALKGSLLLKERDFSGAEAQVERALKGDPSNVVAHSVLAGIQMGKNNPAAALEVLDKAISLNPKELSFYLLKAAVYSGQEDIAAVTKTYREIFELYPGEIRFRFDLATILQEAGQSNEAREIYRETAHDFPKNLEAKHRLGKFIEEKEGVNSAEKEINAYIQSEPDQKIFHLWLADLYIRNAQDDRAIMALKNIIESEPDDWIGLNANTALARIQLGKGDMELAQKLIDAVLKRDVNNEEANLLRANLSFSQGDYQTAITDLRKILTGNPGFLKASRILAEALLLQGRTDLAIDTLIQATKKTPDDKGTLVRLAQLYTLRGEGDKAHEILLGITGIDPSYPVAWETLARLAIENKQWGRADAMVEKLASLEGQQETSAFLKAQIEEGYGRSAEATELYKDVIRKNSSAPIAAYALSALLKATATKEQLVDTKAFLVSLNSQSPTILTVLGKIEEMLGHADAAEAAFRSAILQKPQNQDPYIALAEVLLKQEQTESAIELLGQAEAAIPLDIKASMMRADLLVKSGKVDEAIAVYEKILHRNDMAEVAANNLAQTLADYKREDKAALEKARLVAERFINSDNPYYLDTLGWVYFRQGSLTQAQPILSKAVSLLKEPNPEIYYHYGALLLKQGQNDEAEKYLRLAVSGPKYNGFDEARALLE